MSNIVAMINTEKLMAFLMAVVFIFSLTIVYIAIECIRMKLYAKKAISQERLSMEIINVEMLFTKEKKALERHPTLYSYVKSIDPLFNDYLLDFHKVTVRRYERPKEEMRKFREEYREASPHIQELVKKYAGLLKKIYRTNHPIRFMLDSIQGGVKIYCALFRLIMHFIVNSGLALLFSFTFSQQRKRFEYERALESITESSGIKISENREINCAA